MLLVPLSISTSLLSGELKKLPPEVCIRFVDNLLERCILYMGEKEFVKSKEFNAIRQNSTLYQYLVESVKKKGIKLRSLDKCPVDLSNYTDLTALNGDQKNVACVLVENGFGHKDFNINSTNFNFYDNNIEIVKINSFDQGHFYKKAKILAKKPIRVGENINKVWESRFSQLADYSSSVTIVDRFCLSGADNNTGLKFILSKLCASNDPKCTVVIFAAYKKETELKEEDSNGDMIMPKKNIKYTKEGITSNLNKIIEELKLIYPDTDMVKSVYLYLVHDKIFKKKSHGRFIRFDNTVVEVDLGCELFRHTEDKLKINRAHTTANCQFQAKEDEIHEEIISELRVGANLMKDKMLTLYPNDTE